MSLTLHHRQTEETAGQRNAQVMTQSLPPIAKLLPEVGACQFVDGRRASLSTSDLPSSISADLTTFSLGRQPRSPSPQSPSDRFLSLSSRRPSQFDGELSNRQSPLIGVRRISARQNMAESTLETSHENAMQISDATVENNLDSNYPQTPLDPALNSPINTVDGYSQEGHLQDDYFGHAPISINTQLPAQGGYHLRSGPLSDPGLTSTQYDEYQARQQYFGGPYQQNELSSPAGPRDRTYTYPQQWQSYDGEQRIPLDHAQLHGHMPMHPQYQLDSYGQPVYPHLDARMQPPQFNIRHSTTDIPQYSQRPPDGYPDRPPPILPPILSPTSIRSGEFLRLDPFRPHPYARSPSYSDHAPLSSASSVHSGLPTGRDWNRRSQSPYEPEAPLPSPLNEGPSTSATAQAGRYACPYCSKRFTRPSSLKIHVHSHTGEKPFTCEICGKGFSVSSNLRRHGKIHIANNESAEKPIVPEDEGN